MGKGGFDEGYMNFSVETRPNLLWTALSARLSKEDWFDTRCFLEKTLPTDFGFAQPASHCVP
jgi:hypothetical protein